MLYELLLYQTVSWYNPIVTLLSHIQYNDTTEIARTADEFLLIV